MHTTVSETTSETFTTPVSGSDVDVLIESSGTLSMLSQSACAYIGVTMIV